MEKDDSRVAELFFNKTGSEMKRIVRNSFYQGPAENRQRMLSKGIHADHLANLDNIA